MTSAGLKSLRDKDAQTLAPARALAAEAQTLEGQISDLVNVAYGLTPDEVRLMWDTASHADPTTEGLTHSNRYLMPGA